MTEEVIGQVKAVSISADKGEAEKEQDCSLSVAGQGLKGEPQSGFWHRRVSLLTQENANKMLAQGIDLTSGGLGGNIITDGLDGSKLSLGTRLQVGDEALLEVSQLGEECHQDSDTSAPADGRALAREGIFARVLVGGKIRPGDMIVAERGYRLAIVTASDKGARGERKDKSAELIRALTSELGSIKSYKVVPDDKEAISAELRRLADELAIDLIFTTGGTGLGLRDVTPEATLAVIDRTAPGFIEAMRIQGFKSTPQALLSRAVAGLRGQTLIINLPGSPRAVKENLTIILPVLPHGLEILTGRGGECGNLPLPQ